MPGFSTLNWDQNDRLRSFSTQRVAAGDTPETTWYVYNVHGQRVRKVTECGTREKHTSTPEKSKETRYLPLHDIYTTYRGSEGDETITTAKIGDPSLSSTPTVLIEKTRGNSRDMQTLSLSSRRELGT